MSLKPSNCLITGASRGIGLAIAKALHREGFNLGFLCRSRPPLDGQFISCDFANPCAVTVATGEILQRLGKVDLLVNNAGMFLESAVHETSLEDWERLLRVNLTATFLVTRAVLPQMIARHAGRIINIASTAATQGYLHQAAYCASKHAMLGFARSLAIELKPHNIHVHNICPGGVDTELIQGTLLGERLKGQKMIRPEDIAEAVLFLLRQPDNIDLPDLLIRRFDPGG